MSSNSTSLKKLTQLKSKIDKAEKEYLMAQGALEEIKQNLKKEFKCSTLKEANALMRKLRKKQKAAEKEFNTGLEKFEEEWKDILT